MSLSSEPCNAEGRAPEQGGMCSRHDLSRWFGHQTARNEVVIGWLITVNIYCTLSCAEHHPKSMPLRAGTHMMPISARREAGVCPTHR